MQTAEREEEKEKTIHGEGDIRSGSRVFEHRRGGELFDAGHREGYSFVAASSRSYLLNQ